ncbi:hercynine metabolism protein [Cyanobium sp. Morenito 9A2]|uniref:hercynine metabolism protein n=1 Tax=Cyanobium sp. Morenito 9A2 TaxID=2823718 RepID=UPI0020CF68D2|nr:hercynine metabolism protein [Cyanobium sp. Morenito 9A2]MCP9849502.1 hypothetical protein [Cyanobium sp. Morenito 9A2]
MSASWFEELEARLEQQLEAFLRTNPQQQSLLDREELQERARRLGRRELQLQQQAIEQRNQLLALAQEIATWQQRVERAQGAGAKELAGKAQAHVDQLMGQGRDRWKALAELGEDFQRLQRERDDLAARPGNANPPPGTPAEGSAQGAADLDEAWATFETQQDLEQLKRKRGS